MTTMPRVIACPNLLGTNLTEAMTPASLLARNATLNLLTETWTFIILILAMPRLVLFLGDAAFGLFSLGWVVIGYLTFLDIGVNRAATKFISEHLASGNDAAAGEVIRTGVFANLVLGACGGLLIGMSSTYLVRHVFKVNAALDVQAQITFYAVALAVPVLLVQGMFRAALASYQQFGWINSVNAASVLLQWGAAVFLARNGFGVAAVVFVTVGTRLLATVLLGYVLCRVVPGLRHLRLGNLEDLWSLLHFGGWVSVSQIISPALVYFDRILIASFISLAAVTLYTVPYEFMTRLRVIPSSLASTLYPAFTERGGEASQAQLRALYERSMRYLLLSLLPAVIFFLILGPDIVTVWMGNSFAQQTVTVIQILSIGVLANGLSYVPYNMIQALGRPDLTGKFHLLELPPYVIACFLLIPKWGIAGASLASTLRFIMDFILLTWAAGRYCHCSITKVQITSLRNVLLLNLSFLLLLILIHFLNVGSFTRLAVGALILLLYLPAVWFGTMRKGEKQQIGRALGLVMNQSPL